jgi:prevent-host-death family protein
MFTTAQPIGVREFRGKLSDYLRPARAGERFVVMSRGEPMVEIVRAADPVPPERRPGRLKGQIWFAPNWDAPDDELADLMEGGGPAR